MNTTGSAFLNSFDFKPLYDLSGPVPKLQIQNASEGKTVSTGFNYTYTISGLLLNLTVKTLAKLTPASSIAINFTFERSTGSATALQAALNALSIGVWVVNWNSSTNTLFITSTANPDSFGDLVCQQIPAQENLVRSAVPAINYTFTAALSANITIKTLSFQPSPGNTSNMAVNYVFDRTNDSLTGLVALLNSYGIGLWTGTFTGGTLTLKSVGESYVVNYISYYTADDPATDINMTQAQVASTTYGFVLAGMNTDIVVLSVITSNGPGTVAVTTAFTRTDASATALQAALNALSLGDFTVSWNAATTTLAIYALGNLNNITNIPFNKVTNNFNAPTVKAAATTSGYTACKFWFIAYLPDGTAYHTGSLAAPDKVGVWSLLDIAEPIPQIQGHVPFGTGFSVIGYVNDSVNTYGPLTIKVDITRPGGSHAGQQNNFGVADIFSETKCAEKKIYVEDMTPLSYQLENGVLVSKSVRLAQPPDENGQSNVITSTSTGSTFLFPFVEDSDCYVLFADIIADYVFGNSTVRIKYKHKERLEIFCSISLCELQCSVKKFEDKIQKGGCTAQDQTTLILVNSKYNRLITGILQPGCGVGVPALLNEIKALLPPDCGCS